MEILYQVLSWIIEPGIMVHLKLPFGTDLYCNISVESTIIHLYM